MNSFSTSKLRRKKSWNYRVQFHCCLVHESSCCKYFALIRFESEQRKLLLVFSYGARLNAKVNIARFYFKIQMITIALSLSGIWVFFVNTKAQAVRLFIVNWYYYFSKEPAGSSKSGSIYLAIVLSCPLIGSLSSSTGFVLLKLCYL